MKENISISTQLYQKPSLGLLLHCSNSGLQLFNHLLSTTILICLLLQHDASSHISLPVLHTHNQNDFIHH